MVSTMTIGAADEVGRGGGSVVTVDTRLVAAVQAAAGARCHEAAGLVQAYYFSAEACRRLASGGRRGGDAAHAQRLFQAAKVRLRDFLAQRLLGWIATDHPDERRLNRDRPSAGPRAVVTSSCA
jgi:hypothetical protein